MTVLIQITKALNRFNSTNISQRIDRIDALYGDIVEIYHASVPHRLVCARIEIESGGNPRTVAKPLKWKTGFGSELGLLQLSPDTRYQYKISDEEAFNPETNIRIGCKIWNAWTKKFFSETVLKPLLEDERGAWAWLVTAIGPGAARKLRSLSGGSYDLEKLIAIASDSLILTKNKGSWGSQSIETIAWRVGSAIAIARICTKRTIFNVEQD